MLDKLIKQLAKARKEQAALKEKRQNLNARIETLIIENYGQERSQLEVSEDWVAEQVAELSDAVRQAALDAYAANGDKHPHPAVTIKVYEVLDYDPSEAFEYCTEHLTTALKMDARKFEQVAKVADLDFVSIRQEPRATIASKLEVADDH